MKIYALRYLSLLVVLFFAMNITHAQKFGYINSQALLVEMPDVKQAEANLEALQNQLQKKLQGSLEQLQKDYLAIQEKVDRGELSPFQQEQEAQKLQERQQELAKMEQDMIEQIQKKRADELNPIYEKVNKAIADVAKENGYEFILDQASLIYVSERLNVMSLVKAKLGL